MISEYDLTHHQVDTPLQAGLKYAWRAGFQDNESELLAWSEENHFIVGEKTTDDQIPPVSAAKNKHDYQMVSFVHWPADPCSKEIFGPLLETDYNGRDYHILAYDPNSEWAPNPSWKGGYREYGDFDVIPGKAYWVWAKDDLDLTSEGAPVSTDADIFVALDYNPANDDGWNMIAVPNRAEYFWGDLEIIVHDDEGSIHYGPMPIRQLSPDNPYVDVRLWESKNRPDIQYEIKNAKDFTITPYGGYWVKARAENVSLCFPYDMQASAEK